MAFLINPNGKPIDITDPNQINDKVLPEHEYRKRLLNMARQLGQGCEIDMMRIFAKYDKLMRNCNGSEKEILDIGKMGIVEIHSLLGRHGELVINGQIVCKDE